MAYAQVFCSVTCDRLYEKKTAGPKKPLEEAFSSNAPCYRADARNTSGRVFYANASCYRADAKNTNERGSYHASFPKCFNIAMQ